MRRRSSFRGPVTRLDPTPSTRPAACNCLWLCWLLLTPRTPPWWQAEKAEPEFRELAAEFLEWLLPMVSKIRCGAQPPKKAFGGSREYKHGCPVGGHLPQLIVCGTVT